MGAPLVATDPFASVELLAAYLQVDIDPGDLMANEALLGATSLIQSYCDAVISFVEDETIVVDGSGTETLLLPERPVVEVGQVILDFDQDVPNELLGPGNGSNSQYAFSSHGMLYKRATQLVGSGASPTTAWPNRRAAVQVTYSHGYRIDATNVERAQTVTGTTANTHIAIPGLNADTDTLLQVIDMTTAGHPILTATADGYGIKVSTVTTGKELLVTWEKFIPGLPADVRIITVAVASRAYAQDGATQESAGSYNASYAGQPGVLTEDEKRALDKYKPARRR